MVQYQSFLSTVGERIGVDDSAQVRSGIEAVLGAVAQVLDDEGRTQLINALPNQLASVVPTAAKLRPMDTEQFVGVVASLAGTTPERGRYWAQSVLSALADAEPALGETIAARLTDKDLLSPVGEGKAPRRSAVATNVSPKLLSAEEIERTLTRLPGWTGDTTKLQRTIEIPPERVDPLAEAVRRIEKELDHHAQRSTGPDGLTFVVWTHSLGRVTDFDVQLAERINEAINNVA